MEEEKNFSKNNCDCGSKGGSKCGCASGFYGLGFLGAAIYFIKGAGTFWLGALGLLKAIVWPVFLVYKLFVFLAI